MECLFCKLKNDKDWIIYGDDYFYSILDKTPVSPGHLLVIPKRHVISLFDLSEEEWNLLKDAIINSINAMKKLNLKQEYKKIIELNISEKSVKYCEDALNSEFIEKEPEAFNIGNNEGRIAGRSIDHLHIQIIPRYFGDIKDAVGGIRNVILGKGNYL